MLRLILSVIALAATPMIAACETVTEHPGDQVLSGRVVNAAGAPISASIEIGDQVFRTDEDGHFAISPAMASVYRLDFRAEDHYSMRQTFSHAELAKNAALGDMVLVERVPGRTLFVFGGDLMIGRRFYDPFEGEPVLVSPETRLADSKKLLREMKPYLDLADYASINLETPIFDSPPSQAAPKSVTFYSRPETLDALEWAGVDYVALGNNHTYDFLEPGLDVTLEHLRESDLDFSGAGKDEREALQAHRHSSGSDQFDFLSYVGWAAGPVTQSAEPDKGGAALATTENLLSTTRASRSENGIPILQFHGGLEYVEDPTLAVETRLKQAVEAGAALVIGHHPHVVQGLELHDGKLIAWSLGNFLFDQYFYSAQSAAILYVWMDGDQFYHAESVPIYIKGYHPTPAVGPMRNTINRRLFELSAKRDTNLARSGGHLVLNQRNRVESSPPMFAVATDCAGGKARSGHDLLARGDFDAHDLFDALDRSWLDLDDRITIRSMAHDPANFALAMDLDAEDQAMTGMRKFQRVFTPGTPMSVRAELRTTTDVEVDIYLQIRATGQGLDDALQNGRKLLLGSYSVDAGTSADIDLDFDSPRTRARSLRLLIEARSGPDAGSVELDNLQFIEWKTHFLEQTAECASQSLAQRKN